MQTKQWDREWLEHMYNNRARVPEAEAYIDQWTKASALTRAAFKQQSFFNIAYGSSIKETLDIFMPEQSKDAHLPPVLIFIHGGYWHALDKDNFSFVAKSLTDKGACVVVLNYTLCPHIKVCGIVDEITRAIIWVKRHIAEYGADPENITIAGHSAGGHLAAMMMTRDWTMLLPEFARTSPFKNALSLSGLYEMEPLQDTPFLHILALDEHDIAYANPSRLPCSTSDAYLYSLVGALESEEFQRQNEFIQTHWGQSIVPVCTSIAGLNHFTIIDALSTSGEQVHTLALELLGL